MSPDRPHTVNIAEALRRARLLGSGELEQCELMASQRGITLDNASMQLGMVSQDQVSFLVADECGVDLVFPTVDGVDREFIAWFPEELLRQHSALPLMSEEGTAVIAFVQVPPAEVLDEFARCARMPVRAVLAAPNRIQNALDHVLSAGASIPALSPDASGARTFQRRLASAFGAGADELRFEPSDAAIRVRVRRDGVLAGDGVEPIALSAALATHARQLAHLPADGAVAQTGDCVTRIAGRDVALRVTLLPGAHGDVIVLCRRAAPPIGLRLEAYRLPHSVLDWLRGPFAAPRDAPEAASGLVLVAASSPDLVRSFARAVVDRMHAESSCVVISADATFERSGRVVLAPSGASATIHAARASRPDALVVDCPVDALALTETAHAALEGVRVVLGVVSPSPVDAALDVLDTDGARHRVARALAAVVLLDMDGTEIVAEAVLAGPDLRARLAALRANR